jgi:flagella basal body P-ring formation protein FlgA
MNPRRPLGMRKTIQLMIALTLLAWATQTLLAQWALGAPIAATEPAARTLRDLLIADLAQRTGIAPADLVVTFGPKSEKLLALSEPLFELHIEPQGARSLGAVSWRVTVLGETAEQALTIDATARAWQDQLIVQHSLAAGQVIRATDVAERRVLVERIDGDPPLGSAQAAGNQLVRDVKPGTVLTAPMVEPAALVRAGEFVTVTLVHGGVQVKTVALAMDDGALGQSIRARNEATSEVYRLTVTGPQAGDIVAGDAPAAPERRP